MAASKTTKTVAADPRIEAARAAHSAKKAAAEPVLKATVVDEPATPQLSAWHELQSALDNVQRTYNIVSWKRYVCGLVLSATVSFGIGYLFGWALDILVSAVFMSGYTFLGWALLIVGVILALLAGAWLGKKAFHYVVGGHIDQHAAVVAAAVKAPFKWIGSMFSNNAAPVSAS